MSRINSPISSRIILSTKTIIVQTVKNLNDRTQSGLKTGEKSSDKKCSHPPSL